MLKQLFLNDKFILLLILVNSLFLFIGGYLDTQDGMFWITVIDNVLTSLFIVELIVKFKEYGLKQFFLSNWNLFDFILILISIPALITFILNLKLFDVSYLLVFRILRVFKAFRFFKFIPNVGELVNGVQRALKASVFVFIGFVIYIFVIGLLSFYIFHKSGSEYFSDPTISLYSIFKIFTVEGWFEIPEKIISNYSSPSSRFFTYAYFIFIVMSGGIFGLSIVNSIFVDAMISDNNDEIERKIDTLDSKMNDILTKLNNNETREDT